jgi:flagellar basal-body rod protein FlgB
MPDKVTFAKTFLNLERAIDIAHQRNTYITSNISNIDTPNYKPKEIDFEQALSQALQPQRGFSLARTNSRHIDLGIDEAGRLEPFEQEGEWNGFNWVEIDKEMTKLTENSLVYRTAIETLLRKLTLLKEVIREGGR